MSDWQPIETAPKGGKTLEFVLLFDPSDALCWSGFYDDERGGWFDATGRYEVFPSHWMPLPEPPK